MLTKIKLGLGALSMVLVAGCGGQVQNGNLSTEQAVSASNAEATQCEQDPTLFACNTDDDCAAVPLASCCQNGILAAVNIDQIDAYYAEFACDTPPATCPQFVVDDQRVAQCDFTKHQCQMIDPTQIRCGGFIAPALQHACPDGYECHYTSVPDLPGSCVASSTAN
jgi:hypothetical protein